MKVDSSGFEPEAPTLQGWCSLLSQKKLCFFSDTRLSYEPTALLVLIIIKNLVGERCKF